MTLLNTRPFARQGRADAVLPRESAKLQTLAFGVSPCIQITQIQSNPDIDPLLLSTTMVLYEEGNDCRWMRSGGNACCEGVEGRKDNKDRPADLPRS